MGKKHGLKKLKDTDIVLDKNNHPINPIELTGLCGRGILGCWGPNHAADPIITYIDKNNNIYTVEDCMLESGGFAVFHFNEIETQ